MAEVQMIRSGECSVESKSKTKSSASTEFSDMLKGLTQSASQDKKVTDTKQEDTNNRSMENGDSNKLDSDSKEAVEGTEKTKTENDTKNKVSFKELTGEDFAQLAELVAALSQKQDNVPQVCSEQVCTEPLAEGEVNNIQDVLDISNIVPSIITDVTSEDKIETVLTQTPAEGETVRIQDIQIEAVLTQQPAEGEAVQIQDLSAAQQSDISEGLTDEQAQPLPQMQGEEPLHIETSQKEAVQHTEKEAVVFEEEKTNTAISAAAQPHTQISFIDRGNVVEKMTMTTSVQNLAEDFTEVVITKNMLQEGQPALEITLEPAVLGKITLRVVYQEGRAALSLISDSPKTLELLSQKAGEIAQILQEKTGQETIIFVPETSYTEQGQEDNGQQRGHGRQQQERPKQEQTESFAQQLRLGLL